MTDPETLFDEALRYWRSKKTNDSIPDYGSLDPSEIPTLLPFIFLIHVHWDPLDFSYGLTGGRVRNIMAENRRGRKLSEVDGKGPGSSVWTNLSIVAENGQDMVFTAPYAGGVADMESIRYLSLPWTKSGGRVDVISHLVSIPPDIQIKNESKTFSSL